LDGGAARTLAFVASRCLRRRGERRSGHVPVEDEDWTDKEEELADACELPSPSPDPIISI
jgi:hypothetical protein